MWIPEYAANCALQIKWDVPADAPAIPEPTGMEQIPADKVKEMQAFAATLARKHPHMKPARIMKKVAERFKVKLV